MLYEKIIPMRLYNSQSELLLPRGDKIGFFNTVFMLTKNQLSTLNIINTEFFGDRKSYYKYYYIESIYKTKIGQRNIIQNKKKEVADNFGIMKFTDNMKIVPYSSRKSYFSKGFNILIDLGKWHELFFQYITKTSPKFICENYINFLMQRVNESFFDEYEKIIYIDLYDWFGNSIERAIKISSKSLDNPINIILYTLYKYPDLIRTLGNLDIIIADSKTNQFIKIPTSELTKSNIQKIKTKLTQFNNLKYIEEDIEAQVDPTTKEITKIVNKIIPNTNEEEIEKRKLNIINSLKRNLVGNIDDIPNIVVDDDINPNTIKLEDDDEDQLITRTANDYLDENQELLSGVDDKDVLKELEEFIKKRIYVAKIIPIKSPKELEKIAELQETQNTIIGLPSFEDLKSKVIDETDFSEFIETSNPNIVKSTFVNFDKNYNQKKLIKDIDNSVGVLSKATYGIFITDKQEEDASDQLNLKKTLTYSLEDERGKKMTLKFDVPIILEDKFLYINGSKKTIQHQLILKPLVKTSPNTVQIVSFYNKIFIERKGDTELISSSLKKFLLKNSDEFKIKFGNTLVKNNEYRTSLEFDIIAKNIYSFTIDQNVFVTDINDLYKILNKNNIAYDKIDQKKYFITGYSKKNKEVLYIDKKMDYSDYIISFLSESNKKELANQNVGKRLMYAQCTLMEKHIPLVLFMLFCNGFKNVMEKSNIEYKILSSEEAATYDKFEYGVTQLSDAAIVWKRYPLQNSLIMNGLQPLQMELYTAEELESKETYIYLLSQYYAYANMAFNLDQYKDFMIDDVTKEILMDFNLPTDLVSLLAYSATLLSDNEFIPENNLNNMRIRSNELIAFHIYNTVVKAYNSYRKTQHKKNPTKISVKQDAVISAIMESKLIEEHSVLNPVLELEKNRAVTYKGDRGINLEKAMTISKRGYDESMLGVLGISTSTDSNVGIVRQLTLEPKITSTRGYIQTTGLKNVDSLTSANLLTPAELLTPLGVQHDDPTRTSMAYKQSKYMLMIDDSDPVMIGNRVESIIPYHMSDEFSIVAENNGKVIDVENGIIVIQYSDGTYKSIDINPQVKKNSSSGFYVKNTLISELKLDDKVKKGQILAYNKNAFKRSFDNNNVSMNLGALAKVACVPNWDIFEDSKPITKSLSQRMATTMLSEKEVALSKNSYVDFMVNIGDHVNTGDVLIKFDSAHDDPFAAAFLAAIREDQQEGIIEDNITTITSKFTGIITEIKIYSTVESSELSPSLEKILKSYYRRLGKKINVLKKYSNEGDSDYYKSGTLITEVPEKITPNIQGKIRGTKVDDGVLIIFYIEYKDLMSKGDKSCSEFALKGIVSHVIEEGMEAYSDFRPNEEISTFVAPLAVSARKTPSLFLAMFGNKLLIEAKKQLKELYYEE